MSKSAVTWKGINIYMNSTQRVKLYKSGKNWVTMTIATAAMAFGVATSANQITAYADTAAATPTTAAVSDVKSDASTPATITTTANVSATTNSTSASVQSSTVPLNGEVTKNGANYYYENGQMKTNYFRSVDGKMYYYGDDGKMYQDQFYSNWGNMYYFGKDGARYTNQFYSNWGNMYYFGEDGARYTNRFYQNWGNKYYFGQDGALATNTKINVNGQVHYADGNGVLTTQSAEEAAARDWIAQRESGGNYNARNGIYYGKYQLTISYLGGDLSPQNQDRVADAYVKNRYGSWVGAKNFWLSHHWY